MSANKQITVIIPTYRPGEYLHDCLKSVYAQTLSKADYAVLVVLNGCGEPYASQIKPWIAEGKDEGIAVDMLQTDKPGVSNARNMGIDATRTPYICFVDDDDVVSPTFLQRFMEKADNETIVACDVWMTDDRQQLTDPNFFLYTAYRRYEETQQYSLFRCRKFLSNVCGKIIPMAVIGKRRFVSSLALGEDSFFMFTISDRIRRVTITAPDAIYYARERQQSATRKHIPYKHRVAVCLNLTGRYLKLWISAPFKYDFPLFLSRVAATIYKLFLKNYR